MPTAANISAPAVFVFPDIQADAVITLAAAGNILTRRLRGVWVAVARFAGRDMLIDSRGACGL